MYIYIYNTYIIIHTHIIIIHTYIIHIYIIITNICHLLRCFFDVFQLRIKSTNNTAT